MRIFKSNLFKCLSVIFVITLVSINSFQISAQKNFVLEADVKFENEKYFTAIDLYKKEKLKLRILKKKQELIFKLLNVIEFL